ncbi:MAG TPA: hypothetical protein VFD92_09795 [Candidatus Binatia bacterium]|nr:hypothetical protein [Candidatus Binatia bacterium]
MSGFSDEQVMLTLAGLSYRGFQDVLPGEPHIHVVRRGLLAGLDGPHALAPVRGDWDLVWGPETTRIPFGVFDSNAMYVVRDRAKPCRLVLAVRGTNPVASSDWLFGDLWVGMTVGWPFSNDGAAVSASTALGLLTLQRMKSTKPAALAAVADAARERLGRALGEVELAGRAWLNGATATQSVDPSSIVAQTERVAAHWLTSLEARKEVLSQMAAAPDLRVAPEDLRCRWTAGAAGEPGDDVLSLLRFEARREPLDVVVTGHSKGGALALAAALWLEETRVPGSAAPEECWDESGRSTVRCYAFAGPTPGNAAFAARLDEKLGERLHRIANDHDVVTRAWASADVADLPAIYGLRSAPLAPAAAALSAAVRRFDYRHPSLGRSRFAGTTDPLRPLAAEIVHQHMDAYLDNLGLGASMDAVKFFVG